MILEENPSQEFTKEVLEEAIEFDTAFFVFGTCYVYYEGRSESSFEPCNCLVVGKPDGTYLVHQSTGRNPVNWQKPGCEFDIAIENDELIVSGFRSGTSADEQIDAHFTEIHGIVCYDMGESTEKELSGTEDEMQEKVFTSPESIESGLESITREYTTTAGDVDVLCREEDSGRQVLVELKRRRVGPDAVGQLKRYVDAEGDDVRGILVSPSVTSGAREMIEEHDNLTHRTLVPEKNLNVETREVNSDDKNQ